MAANAEVLEKVTRKLRAKQMPPVGRPRPEPTAREAFTASLEAALDRVASDAPNPGRVAVHRLNRLEYINVIEDLLALEIDPALLPVDDPGIGFDNNADVLSVTPSLMARYLSAATKVSRLAVGNPAIRPAIQVYTASEFAFQDVRMGEDLPFGTHGGLAVRHAFPLDGEYTFKLRLQRSGIGDTIRGMDTEHEIQVRLDHGLVQRFTIGGQYPGYDPGLVTGIPEDDVENQRRNKYRLTADDHLEFRMPVTAGTRLVTASFTDRAPAVSELVPLVPASRHQWVFTDDAADPGIATLQIAGPYEATKPEISPSRQQIFVCRPTGPSTTESCAREILGTLARRAYRRPVTDADLDELMRLYTVGSRDERFRRGHRARAGRAPGLGVVSLPCRARSGGRGSGGGVSGERPRAGLACVVLPLEELARRGAAGACRAWGAPESGCAGAAGASFAGRPEGGTVDERLRRTVADGAQHPDT